MNNPYEAIPREDCERISCYIPKKDTNLMRAISPYSGTFQATLATLVQAFVQRLRKKHLTAFNPTAYANALREFTERSTPSTDVLPTDQTIVPNDGSGVDGMEQPHSPAPCSDDNSNPAPKSGKGKKGQGQKTRNGTTIE